MGAPHRSADWLDNHRVVGYLVIALVSAVAVSGTGVVLHDEPLSRAATTGAVSFAAAFIALLGWSYLFRKAGVDA
ncbi:hypothetical protein BRD19_00185 [Halobacteriales archaeon SW_7_65_23]|nr:MAG: hypothetical protein BRD19_00185 [Halobacteriales archaeon SW_7_65_23]